MASSDHFPSFIRLPPGSTRVVDADEEIFLLYTRLATKRAPDGSLVFAGLGAVDSKSDLLNVAFELPRATQIDNDPHMALTNIAKIGGRKRHARKILKTTGGTDVEIVEMELLQDKTSLRSRKGDTGSVLWRVSVALGRLLLQQLCTKSETSLFDGDAFERCHVLELGAGTGLLGMILSPWANHYTITDLDYLVPLIQKNVTTNRSNISQVARRARAGNTHKSTNLRDGQISDNITIESLDWLQIHEAIKSSRKLPWPLQEQDQISLVLAVDCIYNPSLIPAFIDTLDYFATSRTAFTGHSEPDGWGDQYERCPCVVVAVELRAEDVLRDFLQKWLAKGGWSIWRVDWDQGAAGRGPGEQAEGGLDVCFAVWVGWKAEGTAHDRST